MNTFTDQIGHVWSVVIDDETIKNVAVIAKLNLLDLWGQPNALQRMSEPVMFFTVLYIVCFEQCQAMQLSSIEFTRRVAPAGAAAVDVLLSEYVSMIARKFPGMKDKVFQETINLVKAGLIRCSVAPWAN